MEKRKLTYDEMMAMIPKLVLVTPKLASEWLGRNHISNRKLSKATVESYKADIINGNWRDANPNAPICFNVNGDLIDGQHRLHAIDECGIAVYMMVSENVPLDYYDIFDNGKKRKASDHLIGKYTAQRQALATKVLCVENGKTISHAVDSGVKPSCVTMQTIIDKDRSTPLVCDCVIAAAEVSSKAFAGKSAGPLAFFIYIVKTYGDSTYLEDYLEQMCDKTTAYTSIALPRERLRDEAIKPGRTVQSWILNMLFYSYDSFLDNKDIRKIGKIDGYCDKYSKMIKEKCND